jgi:tripartite ATP-independent transporter DctP family solute receptor
MKKIALVVLCLFLGAVLVTGSAFAQAKKVKTLKMGHQMNPEHPDHLGTVKFKEIVESKTGGSVKVEVYPSDQLGSFFTQMQNLKQGIQQGHVNGLGFPGHFVPEFFLFNTAFAFKGFDGYAKAINGPVGKEIRDKLIQQAGIRLLSVGDWRRGPRDLLSLQPVKSVDDVKGLKIRVPETPSYIASWEALGASPTPIAFGESYLALQQGVVKALECPLDLIYSQKFYEVAKYISITEHLPELIALGVTEKFWQTLTADEKKILEEAAAEAGKYTRKIVEENEGVIKDKMGKAGVTYIEVDKEAFYQKGKNAALNLEKKGIWPKGFYERISATVK